MTETINTYPVVGVMACVRRFNVELNGPQVLLGERLGERGRGLLAPVCGKIELGETARHAMYRELGEEVGLHAAHIIGDPECLGYTEVIDPVHHFVGVAFWADVSASWVPVNLEPKKHRAWGWFSLSQLQRIAVTEFYGGVTTADLCINLAAAG